MLRAVGPEKIQYAFYSRRPLDGKGKEGFLKATAKITLVLEYFL